MITDYVTKAEFGLFNGEFYELRDEFRELRTEFHDFKIETRNKFIEIDRKFDQLEFNIKNQLEEVRCSIDSIENRMKITHLELEQRWAKSDRESEERFTRFESSINRQIGVMVEEFQHRLIAMFEHSSLSALLHGE